MAIKTITVYPSGYVNSASASFSNIENGYTSADSTTYGQINLTTGSGATTYFYYTFDLSEIPSYAIITNVECTVKARISTTSTSYIAASGVRLRTNDIGKGEWADLSTTASTISIVTGEWTRAELDECMVWLYAQRGSSSTSTTRYIRFYGATLTVTYNEPEIVPLIGTTTIAGTAKDFVTGYANIGGAYKELVKSYSCINGTWLPTWGMKMTYSMLSVGDTVTLNVGGVPYEWIVVHQGLPTAQSSSSTSGKPTPVESYDSSCEGTWLLMKNIYVKRAFDADAYGNQYQGSDIDAYLNNTFIGLLDADVQNSVKEVQIPATDTSDSQDYSNYATKIFLLSNDELGTAYEETYNVSTEGICLDYFVNADNGRRIAHYNNTATAWWTRSAWGSHNVQIKADGSGTFTYNSDYIPDNNYGIRPAMIMPSDAECGFAIGGISTTTYTWKKYNVTSEETGRYVLEKASKATRIWNEYVEQYPYDLYAESLDYYYNISIDSSTGEITLSTFEGTGTPYQGGQSSAANGFRTRYFELNGKYYYASSSEGMFVPRNDGSGGSDYHNYGLHYKMYAAKETKDVLGSYITDVTSTNAVAYPTNGVHSDGYWYVLQ